MEGMFFGALSALWLGILTSISPCPLASNIAAISFIGRNTGKTRNVLLSGLFYTMGRTLTYMVIGILSVSSLLSMPSVSAFLQEYMNKILGPVLVLVGILLLEVIRLDFFKGSGAGEKAQRLAEQGGVWGAGLLGILFALAFCPVSAALFFGSLIPLALKFNSRVLLPSLYGVGTALPVILFAFLIAFSVQSVGRAFNRLTAVEFWARRITGVIFILIGIYMMLSHIFGVI
jgi:cytochrome c biogenesis protein CcdA